MNAPIPPRNQQPNPAFANPEYHQTHGPMIQGNRASIDLQPKGRMPQRPGQPNYRHIAPTQRQQMQQAQATRAANSTPLRTKELTNWLASNLEKIFPDDSDKVRRILDNHPSETDMNKLSGYLLEIL